MELSVGCVSFLLGSFQTTRQLAGLAVCWLPFQTNWQAVGCCWLAEGEMIPRPRVRWSGVKGEMRLMWSRWWPWKRRSTAGMKVMKERSRNWSAVGAGCWTVGALPGIERPGGVLSTYRLGPDPWDGWDSWRGEPPCGWWSGKRERWGSSAQPTEWR